MRVAIKRIYDAAETTDGKRILVDRLWPRGVTKERAHLDLWLKEIAPSPALRKAFAHQAAHWLMFQNKYYQELADNSHVAELREMATHEKITLLYAAKDPKINHALVLKNYLLGNPVES